MGRSETQAKSPVRWENSRAFREFVERTDDLVTVVDREGRLIYVNRTAEAVFGAPPAECIGCSAFEFVHPEDREGTEKAFQDWVRAKDAKSFSFENRQVSRTGEIRHMLWTITRFLDAKGELEFLASSARDVTSTKQIEQELARGEARMRALFAGMLDPVVTIDSFGVIQEASNSVLEVFGYRPDELIGKNVRILMPEPHRSAHDGYLENYRDTGETGILGRTREFQVLRKDGERIDCELSVSRVEIPGKSQPLFIGSFRDVTARKRAEHELRERERRYRAIFDQEYQFVGLLSPDGTLLEANRAALQAAGIRRSEVIGKPFWETPWWSHSPEEAERLREGIRSAAAGEFVRFETTHPSRGGGLQTFDFSLKPFRDDEGRIVLLLPEGRDITFLKETQRKETAMLRALATIGESASVLAHEIKNPITAVNIALRAVADQLGQDQKLILEDLVTRMQKLEQTMRRTLSFARPVEVDANPCDAEELVSAAVATLGPQIEQAGVTVEARCAEECPMLFVDAGLIEDVLCNLMRNALEAFESDAPASGEARGTILLTAGPDGDGQVAISVEDDGPGIAPSLVPNLFKPFLTNKVSGTGLGLAVCKKVVEEHGGSIEVDRSSLGGARFVIRLPAYRR